ncbi:uncharacterized protein VTP21DRAFT_11104 [Calcarisporiella thermophila]|uniref:uncharacterized protein n=1 Tax=Calcarisporiella thermophila TaxID=911321 RepID=UPI0037422BE6
MAPFDLATFPVSSTVKLVSSLLECILKANNSLSPTSITHFHSRAIPSISVHAYLARILKFAPFPNEALLSVLVYFDRIAENRSNQGFIINSYNVHRLLIAAIVVASKYTSDLFYPNTRYAKVGGVSLLELNQLELEFLFLCNFDLYVPNEELQSYGEQLLARAALQSSYDALSELVPSALYPSSSTHMPATIAPSHPAQTANPTVAAMSRRNLLPSESSPRNETSMPSFSPESASSVTSPSTPLASHVSIPGLTNPKYHPGRTRRKSLTHYHPYSHSGSSSGEPATAGLSWAPMDEN